MNIVNEMSDESVLRELGNRFSATRIGSRMTQDELSRRAGVSKRSLERLEKGEGGVRVQIVIAVARALRLLGGLNVFIPEVKLSPYDIVDNRKVSVKRVRAKKKKKRTFQWGE